jgi:hypothetical protein
MFNDAVLIMVLPESENRTSEGHVNKSTRRQYISAVFMINKTQVSQVWSTITWFISAFWYIDFPRCLKEDHPTKNKVKQMLTIVIH